MSNDAGRFTPPSLKEFTARALDLAAAYGLPSSAAQEQLAIAYGFKDARELRAHLKTKPSPGPFTGETSIEGAFARMDAEILREPGGAVIWPVGRRRFRDLALYAHPQYRPALMRFQDAIDYELDPRFVVRASNLPVDDYATFVVEDNDDIEGSWMEGKFVHTSLGRRVWEALTYLSQDFEEIQTDHERQYVADEVHRIMENHPNNPYPGAVLVGLYVSGREWFGTKEEIRQCQWLVPIAQRSIELFCSLIPKGFRGEIEPKLVGNWIENFSYSSVLYYGGVAAEISGKDSLARRWYAQCRRACRQDPFGARFALGDERMDLE